MQFALLRTKRCTEELSQDEGTRENVEKVVVEGKTEMSKQRDEQRGKPDREKERAWWMGRQKMR